MGRAMLEEKEFELRIFEHILNTFKFRFLKKKIKILKKYFKSSLIG